ncbi:Uncharacterized protein DAT39_017102 [Clarias magur]|uniref:Uncharacterized protein n=1 Tax=Clarias magur TaxID=1594786 RepID=A0A8J4WWE2_CLAMG|nr:Uncharacterized protein DAT39_017102 [Clarias magur]
MDEKINPHYCTKCSFLRKLDIYQALHIPTLLHVLFPISRLACLFPTVLLPLTALLITSYLCEAARRLVHGAVGLTCPPRLSHVSR